MADVLLVVALKTDQPNIERRLKTILAAAEPVDPLCHTEPVAWANSVDDLVAADLDALAALVGWDAVSRLRVGDVVSGGASYSLADTGSGDAPDSPDTDSPSRPHDPNCPCFECDQAWAAANQVGAKLPPEEPTS